MKIDATVPDVESFVIEYNRFIDTFAAQFRTEGDLESAYWLRLWWKIFEIPKESKSESLELMLTNEGHFILECTDPKFSSEFERFWQECQARWGIADQNDQAPQDDGLSRREREVADLYADGLQKKQIAEELDIEVATVESHVKTIARKLDLVGKRPYARLLHEKGYGKGR